MLRDQIQEGRTYRAAHGGTRLVLSLFPKDAVCPPMVKYRVVTVSRPQERADVGTEWGGSLSGFARWAQEEVV